MERINRKRSFILRICVCAMLVAVGVVLSGILNIPDFSLGAYSMKVGLGALVPILTGVLYGPVYGAMVGALVDFLQAILFPKGAFVPWFTIVAAFSGLIPGMFFIRRKRKPQVWLILIATLVGQMTCSVLFNTALLYWLYKLPWQVLIVKRLVNQAVMIPIYGLFIWAIVELLAKTRLLYRFTDYKPVIQPASTEVSTDMEDN